MRQNGLNQVTGEELNTPSGIEVDDRGGQPHLYVADAVNNRVMAWRDASSAVNGQPADLVLGQPGPSHVGPLGIGARGLSLPISLAVDPGNGDLYVVDFGNNRVVRFRTPFGAEAGSEPDAVYGQPDFNTNAPNSVGIGPNSLNGPRYATFDRDRNLWVADSGNHRVLRFPAAALDALEPAADLVLGQPDFGMAQRNGGGAVSGAGFDFPIGLAVEPNGTLLVADFQNARVLRFMAPISTGQAAASVLGQPDLVSRVIQPQPTAWSLNGPSGLALSGDGRIFVAVPEDHRILEFPLRVVGEQPATRIIGQPNFESALVNAGTSPLASASGLSDVADVATDGQGRLYVADAGNHRILKFDADAEAAGLVLGQGDFSDNQPNRLAAQSLDSVFDVAIDYSREPFTLYVSDTDNHRVLAWLDSTRFADGAPADRVIGQPDLETGHANSGTQGATTPSRFTLSSPAGIVVDSEGRLFVADSGNNRVLRYPRPVDQSDPIEPDAVFGQSSFSGFSFAPVTASKLRGPLGLSISPQGRLFVADSGNSRVLEFDADAGTGAAAVRVFGQADFLTGAAPSVTTARSLSGPTGLYADGSSLYVADTAAHRVVVYVNVSAAPEADASAAFVIGQNGFDTAGPGGGVVGLNAPQDVDVASDGKIYVSDNVNHRVAVYPTLFLLPAAGAQAIEAVGQPRLTTRFANFNSTDGRATAEGLFSPAGLFFDRQGTLYVGDTGNNRLVHYLKRAVTVNASTFRPDQPVSPGSLASVFGGPFAERISGASRLPLPTSLGGRVVEFEGGFEAPLLFLSPNQINLQIPSNLAATRQKLRVRLTETGELIAGETLVLSATSPGLFVRDFDTQMAVALNENGTLNEPGNPAGRGSVMQLFGTGQGPVSPVVADGEGAPSSPLALTVAEPTEDGATCLTQQPSVCVAVASEFGEILFSGLSPGFVGLWQLNVRIPEGILPGEQVPVRAVIDGRPSNVVTIAVQ